MNWIRLSSEYPRHRKTLRLTRCLGALAELYPIRLWLWAVEQSPDGSLHDLSADELAVVVGHSGDSAALMKALVACGFIEAAGRGSFRLKSWNEHQGIFVERAKRHAERMREARARHVPGTVETKPDPEKAKETAKEPPFRAAAVPLPEALNTPAFRSEWADWLRYKAERKEPYKPTGLQRLLAALAKRGAEEAAAALSLAMERGWMGPAAPDALERERRGGMKRLAPSATAPPPHERDPWRLEVLTALRAEASAAGVRLSEEQDTALDVDVLRVAKSREEALTLGRKRIAGVTEAA